jgi:hypothetical protein
MFLGTVFPSVPFGLTRTQEPELPLPSRQGEFPCLDIVVRGNEHPLRVAGCSRRSQRFLPSGRPDAECGNEELQETLVPLENSSRGFIRETLAKCSLESCREPLDGILVVPGALWNLKSKSLLIPLKRWERNDPCSQRSLLRLPVIHAVRAVADALSFTIPMGSSIHFRQG